MKKNEKRTYLSPETEVVRFNVDDIITTSPLEGDHAGVPDPDINSDVEVAQPIGENI